MYIVRPSPARVKRNPQKPGFSRRKELGPRMQSASGGQYPMHNGTDRESLVCLGKHLALPPPTFSRHSPPARCRSHAIHNTIPLKALDLSMKQTHSHAGMPQCTAPNAKKSPLVHFRVFSPEPKRSARRQPGRYGLSSSFDAALMSAFPHILVIWSKPGLRVRNSPHPLTAVK